MLDNLSELLAGGEGVLPEEPAVTSFDPAMEEAKARLVERFCAVFYDASLEPPEHMLDLPNRPVPRVFEREVEGLSLPAPVPRDDFGVLDDLFGGASFGVGEPEPEVGVPELGMPEFGGAGSVFDEAFFSEGEELL